MYIDFKSYNFAGPPRVRALGRMMMLQKFIQFHFRYYDRWTPSNFEMNLIPRICTGKELLGNYWCNRQMTKAQDPDITRCNQILDSGVGVVKGLWRILNSCQPRSKDVIICAALKCQNLTDFLLGTCTCSRSGINLPSNVIPRLYGMIFFYRPLDTQICSDL